MAMRAILVLACLALRSDAAVLRGQAQSLEASLEAAGDWAAYSEAESEDRSFLLNQLDQTEHELMKLQQAVGDSGLAELQISAAPEKKVEAKAAVAAKPAVKASEAKKAATIAKTSAKKAQAAGLKLPGKAGLAMNLAMLKGLYEDSKDRISQSNVREDKSKKWFAGKETEHKAKLAEIEGKFKNHTLSEEFRTNETRDETRYFTYWSRCRERQHRGFHTNLKIQHAMMMKTKKMIDMYEKTLSDKPADQAAAKKQLQGAGGMPDIVFIQEMQQRVKRFCHESLVEVRRERVELQQMAHEALA